MCSAVAGVGRSLRAGCWARWWRRQPARGQAVGHWRAPSRRHLCFVCGCAYAPPCDARSTYVAPAARRRSCSWSCCDVPTSIVHGATLRNAHRRNASRKCIQELMPIWVTLENIWSCRRRWKQFRSCRRRWQRIHWRCVTRSERERDVRVNALKSSMSVSGEA